MIATEFPDLIWLKSQIAQRFRQRRGCYGLPLETDGFPNVVIHTEVRQAFRPDVLGPISLFMNLKGTSRCSVDQRSVLIPEDCFFLTNRQQEYTLEIESARSVETFNIHIGEYFSEQALSAFLTPADKALLDGLAQKPAHIHFHNQLYRKDQTLHQIVADFQDLQQAGTPRMPFEETMSRLLQHLVVQQREVQERIRKMPAMKSSTRAELYHRLSRAVDYLHAQVQEPVTLDELAEASCLSKFHFLRLFRQTFGQTPYQYLQQLRLQKAKQLLAQSRMPIHEIAEQLGFENSNSFSRLFYQRERFYPSAYRAGIN